MEPSEHLGYFLKHPEERCQFPKVNCRIMLANAEGAWVEELIIRPEGKRVLFTSEGLSEVSPTTQIISSTSCEYCIIYILLIIFFYTIIQLF